MRKLIFNEAYKRLKFMIRFKRSDCLSVFSHKAEAENLCVLGTTVFSEYNI